MDYPELGILFDHDRLERIGFPEAVFCQGKPISILEKLIQDYGSEVNRSLLFTRLEPEIWVKLNPEAQRKLDYHPISRTAFHNPLPKRDSKANIAIISAGSADAFVTWEVARTLEYLGLAHTVFEDSGVAGLWRLTSRLNEVNSHKILIVIAGLDAALASVLAGLTPRPIFAVPTSVGYGQAQNGLTALNSMLISCAPGLSVFNIDNGYGAACAAARVVNLLI
ncbi:MAG: circadian phase modifier CpmA [Candidatus Adiutrix intracellularis]|nr:MAG: circadian phase modifier CpmA [Candidatus Adiutrix intracellularis]MDR2827059.1 nickel pincer cofactor biosynthesis protein LarB [Candidatus Adiutrix intracellularis]